MFPAGLGGMPKAACELWFLRARIECARQRVVKTGGAVQGSNQFKAESNDIQLLHLLLPHCCFAAA